MRTLRFGLALALLVACEGSSTPSNNPNVDGGGINVDGGGGGDSGGPITNPSDASDASSSADASTYKEPGISVANLTSAAIDFCFKARNAADWTGPVFQGEGGIPINAASVVRSVPIEDLIALIPAGQNCNATPIFTPGSVTSPNTPRLMLVVRDSDARKVFYRPEQHVAGKEIVYYGRLGRDAVFHPASGADIEIDDSKANVLDANLTGEFRLTSSQVTFTRPAKTGAGVLMLLEAPAKAILCDELAPPNAHLLRCGDDVRVP